ncbi:hypothetical protein [Aeromonas hydrophila]|nr:hypothetical protein [Aeromonas hydrophila]
MVSDIWFAILVWLGNKFPNAGRPLARVINSRGTESYTLYRDGFVHITSGNHTVLMPIFLCSQELQEDFVKMLEARK